MICSTLLLPSCDKDDLKDPLDFIQQQQKDFYGYHVKDKNNIDVTSIETAAQLGDSVFLTGFKNNRIWIALFNEQTKEQLQEWNGTEVLERTIKIDKGYGEYEIFNITGYRLQLEKTVWGFVSTIEYLQKTNGLLTSSDIINKDILFLNGDKIITYSLNNPSIVNHCWFQESIIASSYEYGSDGKNYVISPNGKKLAELKEVPDKEWYIDFIPVSYTEDIGLIQANIYPNNEEIGQYTRIRKRDHSAAKTIWSTDILSLKNLEDNARINASILEQNNPIWKYQIDITNYDGSKQQVIFTVDVETGEVIEI